MARLHVFIACYTLLVLFQVDAQKNPNIIDGRNTIIQMFEWKYADIARECEDFLQHHGYGGVQVRYLKLQH